MASGVGVRKRLMDFYRRQQFRLRTKQQSIRIAIRRQGDTKGLPVGFATLCVVDLFGVFPIIALPAALISCGFYGVPLLMFVITVQIYTAVVLGKCWIIAEKLCPSIVTKSRYPYAAVAEYLYGRYMRVIVTILLDATVFGAGIPNLLVASQNLQLLGHRVSNGQFYFSFCYWLILIGLFMCPIMWLGSPKNMKTLASVSVVTCSIVAALIWVCILMDSSGRPNREPFRGIQLAFPNIGTILQTYGMIAFQFDIHPMLMTIQVDMQEKQKIGHAVSYGMFLTCFMAVGTTVLAAFRYGNSVTSNVLEMLPRSNSLYFAIMMVTLQLCLSSAVGSSALFQHIEDMLGIPRKFNLRRCLVRSLLVGLAVLIGELVPRFDLVMGVIGGTLTGPLIFILPPLFYSKIVRLEADFDREIMRVRRNRSTLDDDSEDNTASYGTFPVRPQPFGKSTNLGAWRTFGHSIKRACTLLYSDVTLAFSVITFGLAATVASTYFSALNVSMQTEFWSPCLHNISYSFRGL